MHLYNNSFAPDGVRYYIPPPPGDTTNPGGSRTHGKGLKPNSKVKWGWFYNAPDSYKGKNGKVNLKNHTARPIWVRVGSPLYNTLVKSGRHPSAVAQNKTNGSGGASPPKYYYDANGKAYYYSTNGGDKRINGRLVPGSGNHKPVNGVTDIKNPPSSPDNPNNPKNPKDKTTNPGGGGNGLNQANFGTFLRDIGNPNTNKIQSSKAAKAEANLQFNAQIQGAQQALIDQGAQAGQNQGDITNWYKQLSDQLSSGDAASKKATQAAMAAVMGSAGDAMNAIGGSANAGSGAVMSQATGDAAGLNMMQQIHSQFVQDQQGANAFAEIGQKSAQKALDSQTMQQDQTNLYNLQGQRGAAIVSNLATILAQNNASRLQNYNNRISKLDTALGAATTVGNQKLQKRQISALPGGNGGNANTPWAKLSATQRYQLVAQFTSGGTDAQGHPIPVPIGVALQRAKGAGYGQAPGLAAYLHTFYTQGGRPG